jgi:hypothetical protein
MCAAPRTHGIAPFSQIGVHTAGERDAAAAFDSNSAFGRGHFKHLTPIHRQDPAKIDFICARPKRRSKTARAKGVKTPGPQPGTGTSIITAQYVSSEIPQTGSASLLGFTPATVIRITAGGDPPNVGFSQTAQDSASRLWRGGSRAIRLNRHKKAVAAAFCVFT